MSMPASMRMSSARAPARPDTPSPQVRSLEGALIMSAPDVPFRLQIGCAAALVSTDIQHKPLKAGFIYTRGQGADADAGAAGAGGGWQRRHALLDPYTQLLFLTQDRVRVPPLVVEGSSACVSVRTGRVACDALEPRHAVLQNDDNQRLELCALSRDSMADWLDCLEIAGAHVFGACSLTLPPTPMPNDAWRGRSAGAGPLCGPVSRRVTCDV